jgi:hypothetical protein
MVPSLRSRSHIKMELLWKPKVIKKQYICPAYSFIPWHNVFCYGHKFSYSCRRLVEIWCNSFSINWLTILMWIAWSNLVFFVCYPWQELSVLSQEKVFCFSVWCSCNLVPRFTCSQHI